MAGMLGPLISFPKESEQAIHHCRLTEDGTKESAAVGRREVSDDNVAASRLFNQNRARGQIPDLVMHVHHRVGGSGHDGGVGIGRPIDPMVRIRASQSLEEMSLVDMTREVESSAQHEPYAFWARVRRRIGQTDPMAIPVGAQAHTRVHPDVKRRVVDDADEWRTPR